MKILLVVTLIICPNTFCFSMDIHELRQVIKAVESAYIDISIDYTWEQNPPMTEEDIAGTGNLLSIGKVQQTFETARPFGDRSLSSKKLRLMDEHGTSFDAESKESYNGNIAKYLSIGGWPNSRKDGTVTKRRDFMAMSEQTPLTFSVFHSYPDLLSKNLENTKLCRIDSHIVRINDCNSISVELISLYGYVYRRIYFSIDHGYTPVRFAYIKNDKVDVSIDVLKFQEVSNGVWFPVKGQIKAKGDERVGIYEAKAVTINQGLTDKDFDFEFPPGTRVVDEIADLQYITQPTEEQFNKWLNDEDIIAQSKSHIAPTTSAWTTTKNGTQVDNSVRPILDTVKTQPKQIGAATDKTRPNLLWVLITFLVIIALIILGITRKMGRAK